MICAWIETSSAETGSSQTMKSRLERERPGDADALALAARELVRVAPAVLGQEPDLPEQLLHAGVAAPPAPGEPVDGERLADDLAHGHARVQRAVGVLEDHLDPAAHRAERRRRERASASCPSKRTDPLVGRSSWRMQRPVVVLPQPDSPTRPSVSPRRIVKLTPSTARTTADLAAEAAPPTRGSA